MDGWMEDMEVLFLRGVLHLSLPFFFLARTFLEGGKGGKAFVVHYHHLAAPLPPCRRLSEVLFVVLARVVASRAP